MRYRYLGAAVLAASLTLGGCASPDGGCQAPSYVVPPPLPPLRIPKGLSAPPDHGRYPAAGLSLPHTVTSPAPGTRREAKPPSGPLGPAVAASPSAFEPKVPAGLSGPPLSSTQSNANGGDTNGNVAPLVAAPAP